MNKMKILFTVMICCLAMGISAQSIVGKWKFEFPTDQGTMVMSANIKADGTYALDFGNDGSAEVTGTYNLSGDTLTVKDDAGDCTGKGVYNVKITDETLTMTRVSDECPNRGGPEGVMVSKRM